MLEHTVLLYPYTIDVIYNHNPFSQKRCTKTCPLSIMEAYMENTYSTQRFSINEEYGLISRTGYIHKIHKISSF